jgi:hypothetical protein
LSYARRSACRMDAPTRAKSRLFACCADVIRHANVPQF